jgi:hypothetical protein
MTAYDPRTGSLWAGGITFTDPRSIFVARKPPGAAFEPAVQIHQGDFYDKGWLAAGPAPGQPATTRLYVAYNLGLQARLTSSPFASADADWPGFEQFLGDYMGLALAGDRVVAVYPSTRDGDLDVLAQTIRVVGSQIFADGFESGTTAAWSAA